MGKKRGGAVCGVGGVVGSGGVKRGRRRVAGIAPGAGTAAGRKARRGVVAVAEPWVGVDSSKPPGWLATPERPLVAVAGRGGRLAEPGQHDGL